MREGICYHNDMRNMNVEDYLLWRGDIPFSKDPLNVIDAVIFNELCYVEFSHAGLDSVTEEPMTLRRAGEIIEENGTYELKTLNGGQEEFFRLAYQSKRFGDVKIQNYVSIFDEATSTQFSAVHFEYDEGRAYIAYRGTDDSLAGWQEDFMIAFTLTKAQWYAREYLNRSMKKGILYHAGGHSKGGNLAMYALAGLEAEKRPQIEHVWIMDAPGFAPDVFDVSRLDWFRGITTKLVPEFCVISKIYEVEFEDTVIVECMGTALMEHDLINWQLDGPKILTAPANSVISDKIMETIMRWAINETIERRKLFISELFDALGAGGAKSVNDISGKGFLKVLEALANTSQETRDVAGDLARLMIRADS